MTHHRSRGIPLLASAVLVAIAAGLSATSASAQETLRYRWTDGGIVSIESPQGPMDVNGDQYAEVTFELDAAGGAVARFDSLTSQVAGPMGDQSPDVQPIRDGTFHLAIDDAHVVTTLDHPAVDGGGPGGLDPLHVFDDFFIPLPEEELRVGLEWTRDFVHEGASRPGSEYYSERSMTLTVRADTVIDGAPAFVVDVSQTVRMEAAGVDPTMGFDYQSSMDGVESGIAIVDAAGRLLHRSRRLETGGLFTVLVQGQTLDMPQSATLTGKIDLTSS